MADITVTPSTFELGLILFAPTAISSFPEISRTPSHAFSVELSREAVLIGSTASGYPVLNPQFTFDPQTFIFELRSVLQADKLIVMAFYKAHKDVVFPWYNDQDDATYEVCFIREPSCRMDGRKDLWRINLELRQVTP